MAGAFKGRRLFSPTWEGLRPTSDRLRETLFNVLGDRVAGAFVLDAFAGTGAVGIEALSRGAAHVTFVESDPRAVRLIQRNLAACRVTAAYTMMPTAFVIAARGLAGARFDLVLLDPPYAAEDPGALVAAAGHWLEDRGWLVLEHAARRATPERVALLERFRLVASGDSALAFYRRLTAGSAADPGPGGEQAERPARAGGPGSAARRPEAARSFAP